MPERNRAVPDSTLEVRVDGLVLLSAREEDEARAALLGSDHDHPSLALDLQRVLGLDDAIEQAVGVGFSWVAEIFIESLLSARESRARLSLMSAKERLLERVVTLSEEEADATLRFIDSEDDPGRSSVPRCPRGRRALDRDR